MTRQGLTYHSSSSPDPENATTEYHSRRHIRRASSLLIYLDVSCRGVGGGPLMVDLQRRERAACAGGESCHGQHTHFPVGNRI